MKIHCYLESGMDKEVSLGMLNLADDAFLNESAIVEDINRKWLNYGDILIVRANNTINNKELLNELAKLGVSTRIYKGDKTNLDNIVDYDNFIKDFIKKRKEGICTTIYSEAKNSTVDYARLSNYIQDSGLLSKCNKKLYDALQEVKNMPVINDSGTTKVVTSDTIQLSDNSNVSTNNMVVSELQELCNKHNINMADLACLMVRNISSGSSSDVSTKDLKEVSEDSRYTNYIKVIQEYVSDDNYRGVLNIAADYNIKASSIEKFIARNLYNLDSGLYKKYKDKVNNLIPYHYKNVSKNRLSDTIKYNVALDYINGNISLKDVCVKSGVSHKTIYNYINNTLKVDNPVIYDKYRKKVRGY